MILRFEKDIWSRPLLMRSNISVDKRGRRSKWDKITQLCCQLTGIFLLNCCMAQGNKPNLQGMYFHYTSSPTVDVLWHKVN